MKVAKPASIGYVFTAEADIFDLRESPVVLKVNSTKKLYRSKSKQSDHRCTCIGTSDYRTLVAILNHLGSQLTAFLNERRKRETEKTLHLGRSIDRTISQQNSNTILWTHRDVNNRRRKAMHLLCSIKRFFTKNVSIKPKNTIYKFRSDEMHYHCRQ